MTRGLTTAQIEADADWLIHALQTLSRDWSDQDYGFVFITDQLTNRVFRAAIEKLGTKAKSDRRSALLAALRPFGK